MAVIYKAAFPLICHLTQKLWLNFFFFLAGISFCDWSLTKVSWALLVPRDLPLISVWHLDQDFLCPLPLLQCEEVMKGTSGEFSVLCEHPWWVAPSPCVSPNWGPMGRGAVWSLSLPQTKLTPPCSRPSGPLALLLLLLFAYWTLLRLARAMRLSGSDPGFFQHEWDLPTPGAEQASLTEQHLPAGTAPAAPSRELVHGTLPHAARLSGGAGCPGVPQLADCCSLSHTWDLLHIHVL